MEDGSLYVPLLASGPGRMIGDGIAKLEPGELGYDEYLPFAEHPQWFLDRLKGAENADTRPKYPKRTISIGFDE